MTNLTNPKARELLAGLFDETPEEEKPQVAPPSDPRLPGYQVHSVLAGAYKGKGFALKVTLSHYAKDWVPLCKTVKADSLCDPAAWPKHAGS